MVMQACNGYRVYEEVKVVMYACNYRVYEEVKVVM